MISWHLLADVPQPEGGLFDLDATLPLMAVQVVILTFVLNKLFFQPVGNVVEERETFVSLSYSEAKQKLEQAERLTSDLRNRLKTARQQAQAVIAEAEAEVATLHQEAIAAAKAKADATREQARAAIDAERTAAMAQLDTEADALADLIVQRLSVA